MRLSADAENPPGAFRPVSAAGVPAGEAVGSRPAGLSRTGLSARGRTTRPRWHRKAPLWLISAACANRNPGSHPLPPPPSGFLKAVTSWSENREQTARLVNDHLLIRKCGCCDEVGELLRRRRKNSACNRRNL